MSSSDAPILMLNSQLTRVNTHIGVILVLYSEVILNLSSVIFGHPGVIFSHLDNYVISLLYFKFSISLLRLGVNSSRELDNYWKMMN